jgi:hypothetical protein
VETAGSSETLDVTSQKTVIGFILIGVSHGVPQVLPDKC